MSYATAFSRAQDGVHAPQVTVEVHLSGGLPAFTIVGLPEAAVRESRDRVRAALLNTAFEFPQRRITVSLAPADLPKDGSRFDLPIALGLLAAQGQIPAESLQRIESLGELSLSGELRRVIGVLPAALQARDAGRTLVLPVDSGADAALVSDADVRVARTLPDVCAWLSGRADLPRATPAAAVSVDDRPDLADVRGQHRARRALEIAAAGGHNLLFVGPPGTGKTMLASRLAGILPPLAEAEALEAAAVASVCGMTLDPARFRERRFRSPHHTASAVALVGGGSAPRPGEISLAHHGVLFLDELPEWNRHVLEVLREPLESGRIMISRAARQAEFPAAFQLVAAMNPCPCGYAGDPAGRCRCSGEQIARYRARLSGPLLDRIDLHVEVPRLARSELAGSAAQGECSAMVRERVIAARRLQLVRAGRCNARLDPRGMDRDCALGEADQCMLEQAVDRLGLSARAQHRVLRVARTIADLAGSPKLQRVHLSEALAYRVLDRRLPAAASI